MSRKVLIIDDDSDDAELLCEVLKNAGVAECDCVNSTDNAFTYLNDTTELPDAIFLDMYMPKIDGIECLKKLKDHKRFQHIPVIVFSCSLLDDHKNRSLTLGAKSFIKKPLNAADYKSVVRDIEDILF